MVNDVIFIGAGNLATNLAKALKKTNYRIVQVFSRTRESASTLAKIVDADSVTELAEVRKDASIYIVSLKDSVLTDKVAEIVNGKPDALILHTAGSISISVFEGYAAHYGVFYPMQTFSKMKEIDFKSVPCYIEASSAEDLIKVKQLAESVSDHVEECSSEQRKYLHLAAVFVCNFTNHLYDVADCFLHEHQLSFNGLLPLIDETARKVHEIKPGEAQTGPAIRFDENVIHMQSALLHDHPVWQDIYNLLSKSIHENNKKLPNP